MSDSAPHDFGGGEASTCSRCNVSDADEQLHCIQPSDRFKHYKGQVYHVLSVATETDTLMRMVVYTPVVETRIADLGKSMFMISNQADVYVRGICKFSGKTELGVLRFEKVK